MNLLELEYPNVYISGDIHGEFEALVHNVTKRYELRDSVVIVAGDCGFGFHAPVYYEQTYKKLSKALRKANVMILCVRGNHDDPAYFGNRAIDFPYLKTIPDYTVVKTTSHNILCVGGAISVDRYERLSQMILDRVFGKKKLPVYWEDEEFVFSPEKLSEIKNAGITIDTVISHTAPVFCPPYGFGNISAWFAKDQDLENDLGKEKREASKLYRWLVDNNMPLNTWFYGHFHDSYNTLFEDVRFYGLDIHEIVEFR